MKSSSPLKWFATREGLYYVALAVLLVVLLPLALDPFRLNMVGKYLTYAFVAIGLVMCWARPAFSAWARVCSLALAATVWPCS